MDLNVFPLLTEEELQLPLYVCNSGRWKSQPETLREEGHLHYQWLLCQNGEGRLEANGRTYAVHPGQIMLTMPHERHYYYPVREPWEVSWVVFDGKDAAAIMASLHFTKTQVLSVSNPDLVLKKMNAILTLLQSKIPLRGYESSSSLYDFLLTLYTSTSETEVRSKQQHYEQLSPVLDFIEERYEQPLTLQDLAQALGVSIQYTCRLFQQTLGMRPFEYITRTRIRKAKEMLLGDTDLSVNAVADKVGYDHPSYFIKRFKEQEGVTPSMFRRIYRP